jgi:ribonuclease PH
MNDRSEIIEIQGTAEGVAFNKTQLTEMLSLGEKGILELISLQKDCLSSSL